MQQQYAVPEAVQEFLSQLPSAALTNVVWNIDFSSPENLIPMNPGSTRRSLVYDKAGFSADATPNPLEYNCWLKSLDNSTDLEITFPRGV